MWQVIQEQIQRITQRPLSIRNRRSIGGGSINQAYQVSDDSGQHYFIKLNQASKVAMFEAEALGLRELAKAEAIRIPQPLCWGTAADQSYIVLEWLELRVCPSNGLEADGATARSSASSAQ